MAHNFDVCIRGAGIVGASLALLLAQQRLRVALVEAPRTPSPTPPLAGDVRAYALNHPSTQLLQALRAWPDGPAVTPVTAMRVHGDQAGMVNFASDSLSSSNAPTLASIVDVAALENTLRHALAFQPQVEVVQAPQAATLTVVCEGRFSSTRAEFGVDVDIAPYGQVAIATRLQCERPHQGVAEQWFSAGDIMAFLPLDGPQGNSVALVWSVSEDNAPALMALSPELFSAAVEQASGAPLGRMTLNSERACWPLQYGQARRWGGQTAQGQAWVLAGDAAHSVHPLAGQGLNLGLADVQALATILSERDYWRHVGDQRLLRQYERTRRAGLVPMGAVMDGLQRLFARPDALTQQLRNWGMQGFERSGPLKQWVAKRAMGLR